MKKVLQMWLLALAVLVGVSAEARPAGQGGAPQSHGEMSSRLSRRGAFGRINIQGGRKHIPDGAEVCIERKRPDDVKAKIHKGWKNRTGRARSPNAPQPPQSAPNVLASYDISIRHGGRKWQPDAGDPVRVDVELDAPVPVTAASTLGVVHLSDDGTVETLPSSRYGFTYNAAKTAVTAFWFDAGGFSVYAIVDNTPARRIYSFYTLNLEDGAGTEAYVPHYFITEDGNKSFRQIVKTNEKLERPEALPSPSGLTFAGWHLYDPGKAGTQGYDSAGYAEAEFNFDEPIVFDASETGVTEYTLRAMFAHQAYVIFHEQPVGDKWPIAGFHRGRLTYNAASGKWETAIDISDMTVTYDDEEQNEQNQSSPRKIFRGWSYSMVNPGESLDVNGNPYTILESPITITVENNEITGKNLHATKLYPVFLDIHWLSFQAAPSGQGASYVAAKYYYSDEGAESLPTSTRTGYTFAGWYTAEEGGVQVATADGTLLTNANLPNGWGGYFEGGKLKFHENVTLYGHWTPADTQYTIVIWQQKVTDAAGLAEAEKSYDFYTNIVLTARTGNSVSVPANPYQRYSFANFSYGRCDNPKTVVGNGTTVLNVYYDRNERTLTFNDNITSKTIYYITSTGSGVSNSGVGTKVSNASNIATLEGSNKKTITGYEISYYNNTYCIKIDGDWYAISNYGSTIYSSAIRVSVFLPRDGSNPVKTVTALAGSVINDKFPIVRESDGYTYTGKSWKGNVVYTERLSALEVMPDRNITFTLQGTTGRGGTLYYWVEVDEEESEKTQNGKHYKLYKTIEHDFNYLTYTEDFHPITGYTNLQSNTDASFNTTITAGSKYNFYYDRLSFNITLTDSYENRQISQESVKYNEILAARVPKTLTSARQGYSFSGWYADSGCTTRVFFDAEEFANSDLENKVLYERMPANNLQLFAGWSADWYLIKIDPNGGKFMDGADQSLWFWKNYGYTEIIEYTTVTRPYVESVNGDYYYAQRGREFYDLTDAWENREDDIRNRRAYYTDDPSDPAIVDSKRYKYQQNSFRYAGWYEVKEDGTEDLYAFGSPVQHNLLLRLHWKQLGTYKLVYMSGNLGTVSSGDENETTFTQDMDLGVYADNAELLVTRTANPTNGYIFVGWKIRGGDGTLYRPGDSFTFKSVYVVEEVAADGTMVKQLVLDAVYERVKTVSLKLDANGGTVNGEELDAFTLGYDDALAIATNVAADASSVTLSGMRNNAYGTIGGAGFSYVTEGGEELEFLGWNTEPDGTGTHFDKDSQIILDELNTTDGENVLYAEWGVKVYFYKNNEHADWVQANWDSSKFTYDEDNDRYWCNVVLNGYATPPPANAVTTSEDARMFSCWSSEQYKDTADITPFDFATTRITGPTKLFARWQELIEVQFHAVDASAAELVSKDADWLMNGTAFDVDNTTDITLADVQGTCVSPDSGYVYAFACVSDSLANVSKDRAITRLYYNTDYGARTVYVEYDDADHTCAELPNGFTVYFVYFKNVDPLAIGYKVMGTNGTLMDASVSGSAPTSTISPVGTDVAGTWYDMAASVTQPISYPSTTYNYYSFAIGEVGATGSSQLHIITATKSTNADRPAFRIRNTWRGYEYSMDEGVTWNLYGHDAQLYVVYFEAQPTIITLNEQTIGTETDVAEQFEYVITVTNVEKTVEQTQTRTISGGYRRNSANSTYKYGPISYGGDTYWCSGNWTDWSVTTSTPQPTSYECLSCVTKYLINGGTETVTLLSQSTEFVGSASDPTRSGDRNGNYTFTETRIATITTNAQMVVITQKPKTGFTSNWTDSERRTGGYVYTGESVIAGGTRTVVYTNTRESLPVPLHVAVAQATTITTKDDDYRTTTASGYTLTVPLSAEGTFAVALADLEARNTTDEGGLLAQEIAGCGFGGVFYGTTNEAGVVTVVGSVTSVGFVKKSNSDYYGICLNDDPSLALADYAIFYVYCEIPKIYYVQEHANGVLSQISPITYNGNPLTMNGEANVTQGEEVVGVGGDAPLTITVSGQNNYRVPPALDGVAYISMSLAGFAIGPEGTTNTSGMDGVTSSESIQLQIINGLTKWSVDGGATWNAFSDTLAVYAIYKEAGYDLTITETSLANDADKAADSFTVTITSKNLSDTVDYEVSGYVVDGTTIHTMRPSNHTIMLTVTNGSMITLHALPHGTNSYTLVETLASEYKLQGIKINGEHNASQALIENGTAQMMDRDKVVEFTNIKSYMVTFVSEDGAEVLKEATGYWYGTKAAEVLAPETEGIPSKPMDAESIYRFNDWLPTVTDVVSNTVYTAAYKAIKIPSATQRTEDATNIVVTLSGDDPQAREEALIAALQEAGIDIEDSNYDEQVANDLLNSTDPNGLTRWENLVTGTDTNEPPLSTSVSTDETQMTVQMAEPPGTQVDLGYTMLRDLRRYDEVNKKWNRIAGPTPAGNPAFNIPLVNEQGGSIGATGLYRVFTLLVPDVYQAITNEIPSANIIGVLEVVSPLTNTVVAVPWKELASDPAIAQDITVSNYVSTVNLTNGDRVYALPDDTGSKRGGTDASAIYEMWTLEHGKWDVVTTVSGAKGSDTGYSEITPADPSDKRRFPRTKAVWVQRQRPLDDNGNPVPFFLVGQYEYKAVDIAVAGGSKSEPGYALISVPSYKDFSINDLDWTGYTADSTDFVRVVNGAQSLILKWSNGKWCAEEQKFRNGIPAGVKYVPYATPLKAGTGFWFCRHGTAFAITWTPAEEVK